MATVQLSDHEYQTPQMTLFQEFASRDIWWKTPAEALLYPERILAQVMNIGTFTDLGHLLTAFSVEELRGVLRHAEPGWFNERSWAYWHLHVWRITIR